MLFIARYYANYILSLKINILLNSWGGWKGVLCCYFYALSTPPELSRKNQTLKYHY